MTDSIRAQAERQAEEGYPENVVHIHKGTVDLAKPHRDAYVSGFLDGRTITPEQLEAAAEGMFLWDIEEHPEPKPIWGELSESQKDIWRSGARAAFEAAGFRIADTTEREE